MREYLFRGKRIDNGQWIYGYYIKATHHWHNHGVHEDWIATDAVQNGGWCNVRGKYAVSPKTIGQYTGLTDKNGKKIFEGDIIRYAYITDYEMYNESLEFPEEYEGVDFSDLWTIDSVVYGIGIGYPAFDLNNHEWECNGLSNLSESCLFIYEVIGNIHDNPELLGGEL
jgi:uncharacterized phage protein (TIGR01671 family)